uniref:C-type lectin domain-containing protein n=1 Tax=Acrobeloides nanus TaxID=290746 RepID=A0A914CPI5_9BILA
MNSIFLVFLLPILSSQYPIDSATVTCPEGASQFDNKCYLPVNNLTDWIGAEFSCLRMGGNLATPKSAFENSFLKQLAQKNFGNSESFWLGGTSIFDPNGKWHWVDMSNMTYTNWAKGNEIVRHNV